VFITNNMHKGKKPSDTSLTTKSPTSVNMQPQAPVHTPVLPNRSANPTDRPCSATQCSQEKSVVIARPVQQSKSSTVTHTVTNPDRFARKIPIVNRYNTKKETPKQAGREDKTGGRVPGFEENPVDLGNRNVLGRSMATGSSRNEHGQTGVASVANVTPRAVMRNNVGSQIDEHRLVVFRGIGGEISF
jgi:hypothetical protein